MRRQLLPALRMLLAERHNLPRHVLDQLAGDRDAKILKFLAANPTLSAAQLQTMVAAHGPQVAARVAANPSCPPALLPQLARQTPPVQKALRRYAASHPTLPVHTILHLLTDADIGIAAAAANPSLPFAAMRDLAATR